MANPCLSRATQRMLDMHVGWCAFVLLPSAASPDCALLHTSAGMCKWQEDLELLKTGLAHVAALCGDHPAWAPVLVGPALLQLLQLDRPLVRPEVRRWVFTAVQNALSRAVDAIPAVQVGLPPLDRIESA